MRVLCVQTLRPVTFLYQFPSFSSIPMSSPSSNSNLSVSRFQAIFDAALREYRQKTGKDIATEPLTAKLLRCDSSEAILRILQEQAHAFNEFRNGDRKVQLMRWLKPTVEILYGLSTSGVFGEGIGLVRLTKLIYPLRKFIVHPAETSTSTSDICWCWSSPCGMYPFSGLHVCSRDT